MELNNVNADPQQLPAPIDISAIGGPESPYNPGLVNVSNTIRSQIPSVPPTGPTGTDRLTQLTQDANAAAIAQQSNQYILNVPIRGIFSGISDTVNGIMNDLFMLQSNNISFAEIFTKGSRLMYLGVLLTLITIAVILIRFSETQNSP